MSGLEEFEQLVLKAEKNTDTGPFDFNRNENGWSVITCGPSDDDAHNVTFAEMIEHLRKLAKPKKPDTITVPYEWAKYRDERGAFNGPIASTESVNNACKEAIKPYED